MPPKAACRSIIARDYSREDLRCDWRHSDAPCWIMAIEHVNDRIGLRGDGCQHGEARRLPVPPPRSTASLKLAVLRARRMNTSQLGR